MDDMNVAERLEKLAAENALRKALAMVKEAKDLEDAIQKLTAMVLEAAER